MFERLQASFSLAHSSWLVLLGNKKLIFFPLVSGFCCLLVLMSFAIPAALMFDRLRELIDDRSPLLWVGLFLFYFVNYFVIVFFNSALVTCALLEFEGEEATLADGLGTAASRLPQILAWAFVSATIGVLLKMIENVHEKAGVFISSLLGTAWTVVTFFVVPILVVEKTGPIDAVKRSVQVLKKTWGEALIGNFGLGLFTFLLFLPAIAIFLAGGYLAANVSMVLGLSVLALGVVYVILWGATSSALNGIFVSALYDYAARSHVPAGFDRGQMEHAFRSKA